MAGGSSAAAEVKHAEKGASGTKVRGGASAAGAIVSPETTVTGKKEETKGRGGEGAMMAAEALSL